MKIAACSVVCALLCAVLKPHEGALALAVSVLAAAGAAVAALGLLSPVLEFFEKLRMLEIYLYLTWRNHKS